MDNKLKNELAVHTKSAGWHLIRLKQQVQGTWGFIFIAEILSVLYFCEMRINLKNPEDPNRDRLVLSKGHCSPVMYTVLAMRGFFPVEHLGTFRKMKIVIYLDM